MTAPATVRHVIELGEYQQRRVEVPPPSQADKQLADRLVSGQDGVRLDARWMADGTLDVGASSWVGVVRFSSVDVRVVPKLVGGSLRVLRMLEYASGVSMLRRLPVDRPLPANGKDLFDLICLLLAQETEALMRDGLLRDYRTTDDSLEVLRGRLRYREQFLRRFGQLDRLECEFDEYDGDTPINQLVAAALGLARQRVRETGIRFAVARLTGVLDELCRPTSADAAWYERVIRYDRRNERYRPAHELSKLVLRGLAFNDLFDVSAGGVSAFLIDMNAVFERFVTRLVRDALHDTALDVSAQHPLRAVVRNDDTGRSYSTLTPDLVITDRRTGHSVPFDIKYKTYDVRKISTADIYQTFLYAYALGHGDEQRRAGILYPATTSVRGPHLSIKPLGAPIAARILGSGIDVPRVLDDLAAPGRQALLDDVRTMIKPMATGDRVASSG
jgi:5-methylcytosine-specific restriction enzyme subunit McrC